MAATPALPLGGAQYDPQFVPIARASRIIPEVWQPNFGLRTTAVIPGSVPVPNAFYNPTLQFYNDLLFPQPPTNLPINHYLPYIPGLSRAPQP